MLPRDTLPAGPVVLRLPRVADADAVARACADPQIIRFLPVPAPYTRDDALAWITTMTEQTWQAGGAQFAIADPATGDLLGAISIRPPDPFGASMVGYWIAPWARGQGFAVAATRALAEWAIAQGVTRLSLLADVENVPSQSVACRAGFTLEGVLRGARPRRDGTRADYAAFARLATDRGEAITPYLPFFPGGYPDGSLSDGVVRLTPLTSDDTADYRRLLTTPDIVRFLVPPMVPPSEEEIETRCRQAGHDWLAGRRVQLAIRDAATGAFAGDIQLTAVLPALGEAMIGYSLLPAHRGRGLMTRSVNLLVDWAFTHTALGRIVAGTAADNTASHRVLERAGFTRECLVRGLLPLPDGTRADDLRWARLR